MSAFYKNYIALCNNIGKSPSAVAIEIGLSKAAVNGWKCGRSNPTDATLTKISDYFGVSVSALTSEGEKKARPPEKENEQDPYKMLLVAEIADMSDEDCRWLLDTIKMIKGKRGK